MADEDMADEDMADKHLGDKRLGDKDVVPLAGSPAGGSRLERTATTLVSKLIDAGIDGVGPLDPAAQSADAARARASSADEAIDQLVTTHLRLAAAQGFVTGLGGFITLPVALPANVVGFYGIATRLVASIAHLRGYDLQRPEVRSAVLLVLVGADARSVLAKTGLSPTKRIADLAMQRLPGPALMVLNKGIGFNLLSQLGKKGLSRLGRGLPLVGGVIGGGMDYWLLRKIADGAKREFVAR